MEGFENRVAPVTGAGSGIGEATALAFVGAGVHGVVLAGRRATELERVAKRAGTLGAPPLIVSTDMSREDQVADLIARALGRFGRLDAAFNNAGDVSAVASEALFKENWDAL